MGACRLKKPKPYGTGQSTGEEEMTGRVNTIAANTTTRCQ